ASGRGVLPPVPVGGAIAVASRRRAGVGPGDAAGLDGSAPEAKISSSGREGSCPHAPYAGEGGLPHGAGDAEGIPGRGIGSGESGAGTLCVPVGAGTILGVEADDARAAAVFGGQRAGGAGAVESRAVFLQRAPEKS